VLSEASKYLRTVTDGRYVAIRYDSQNEAFQAQEEDGAAKSAEQWNRGLREQLYLAVRFGYIQHYCQNNEPLPIVLDDTLANCDPEHTRRTAEVLVQLARERQILYLTCHRQAAAQFRRADPQIAHYRLDGQAFQATRPA